MSTSADQDAGTDPDAPSGLPTDEHDVPLGTAEETPEGEGDAPRGEEAMPGIPTGGEPPSAG